jgi:hypothetical protein
MKPVLVIGDVHGHYERLERLLCQEGILGEVKDSRDGVHRGRINNDVEVIQLGDLGHFGQTGSPTGDRFCYEAVRDENWCDLVLWGNHDRYVVDEAHHAFGGCQKPGRRTRLAMEGLVVSGQLVLAAARHGVLLTHAGLHKAFRHNAVGDLDITDAAAVASYINSIPVGDPNRGIIDAVSVYRGGRATVGGILWRDAGEALYPLPQVFGHSKRPKPKMYYGKQWWGDQATVRSYCVDVGTKDNGRLAGIWLPEERIVEVKGCPT